MPCVGINAAKVEFLETTQGQIHVVNENVIAQDFMHDSIRLKEPSHLLGVSVMSCV
jgi:hypothetical protein